MLTEREGRSEEHWLEVVAVVAERSEVRAKTTQGRIKGKFSAVSLKHATVVSGLLYYTRKNVL